MSGSVGDSDGEFPHPVEEDGTDGPAVNPRRVLVFTTVMLLYLK